jgi:RNA-directed DNA polymerase
VNTDAPVLELTLGSAERRVLEIQAKLHRWAKDDPQKRFDDLFNLVVDPAFLLLAWERVRTNQGARTAGVDGVTAVKVQILLGAQRLVAELRQALKEGRFRPLPVRERLIPKPGTRKKRRLGIPTVMDRVVQASLKLVLEPIFEADFQPCSYGFRPYRRAHDAIAEARHLMARKYEWVVEGDITACFDEIDHTTLTDRLRRRVGDRRVLDLVKAFLKSGILGEDRQPRNTSTGAPQGGILSPLLANVALSVMDDHFTAMWSTKQYQRERRRKLGLANYRLVRYADDFLILVQGEREHAEAARDDVAAIIAPMGLRLSAEKTLITHIDEGLDFLGWHIQRRRQRGASKQHVYTYPSKKSILTITRKIKTLCLRCDTSEPIAYLAHDLGSMLRGWTAYFRYGVSKAAFNYVRAVVWRCVMQWIRRKHRRITWKDLRRRYCAGGWWPTDGQQSLFDPASVGIIRYRYRGTKIDSPWATAC